MNRIFILLLFVLAVSCKKNDDNDPQFVIPPLIQGSVKEFNVDPIDINTPDKGTMLVSMTGSIYKVEFNAAPQASANAVLSFQMDTLLTDDSREYANFGNDFVAWQFVRDNQVEVTLNDGRRVSAFFDFTSSFGGTFGESLISQWRTPGDPTKPNQKAKDDLRKFVRLYDDKDDDGPGTDPIYLSVQISKN
jgi:hypothetical protein